MSALSAARLLAAGTAWRLTGLDATGRSLLSAATGPRPNDRELAGMLLTQAGDKSVPLIGDALSNGAADPSELVTILASIGTPPARAALETAAHSTRPDVVAAAREALHTLDQIRRRSD